MINGYIPPSCPFGPGMLQPQDSNPPPSSAADVPITKHIYQAHPCCGEDLWQETVQCISEQMQISQSQSNKFYILLHNVKGGPILCKRKPPAPPLDDIDLHFKAYYDKATHRTRLWQGLNLTHINPPMREGIYKLLKQYWSMFEDKDLLIPIKDYKFSLDTGSAPPICIKNIHYSPQKILILHKCISSLAKLGHICQIHGSEWMFKALLAPKPHQEHVHHIDIFVWRFCINYIPLTTLQLSLFWREQKYSHIEKAFG